ncbi:MAG TPA: hypothetical protein VJV21_05540 [Pyrinomonadaceae bacterium]|nr:hypothetical protein [Pyrinomonadaceae bacterium]
MKENLSLEALERRAHKLERWLRIQSAVSIVVVGLGLCAFKIQSKSQETAKPQSLKVSELVVVDPKGVERVRIGGDLPDAVYNGKRVPRGGKAAGVLLYDDTGRERGGYVTWGSENIGLTLDSAKEQVALFAAGLKGSALSMRYGNDMIELRSDEDGSRITAVHDSRIVMQQPGTLKISSGTCEAYRGVRAKGTLERAMISCQRRFTESACRACLEQK